MSPSRPSIVYDVVLLGSKVELTRVPLMLQLSLYITSALVVEDTQETVAVDDVLPITLKSVGTGGVPMITHTHTQKLSYLCKQESEGSQLLLSNIAKYT